MSRLVEALKKAGQTFKLFQRGEIGPCDSTPSAVPIPNLVPSTFCRIPTAAPVPVEEAPVGIEGAVPEVKEGAPEMEGAIVKESEEIDPSAPDLQIDPQDQRIDVRAKFALQRMLKVPVTEDTGMAKNAARLIRGINSETLEGIYGDDLGKAVEKAQEYNTDRWKLVPKGEDAALVLDKEKPLKGPIPPDKPPTVIFRGDTPDISKEPGRLDVALKEAGQTFDLWQEQELGSCDNTGWIVPVTNLVPSSYCTSMGIPSGKSACSTLKRPEILDNFDQGKSDLKLSHKRKICIIARCVKDRHGTPDQIDTISLIGHASTEGDPKFNETLGQRRADEVRNDLIIALDRETPGLSGQVLINTETRGPYESRNLGLEKDRRVEVFLPHKAISTACELLVTVTTAEADHKGAIVEGATVEVTGPLISEKLTKDTNEFGQALFQNLEPGTYHVTASKKGFEEASTEVLLPENEEQIGAFAGEGALTSAFDGEMQKTGGAGKAVLVLQSISGPDWFLPNNIRPLSGGNEVRCYISSTETWENMGRAIELAVNEKSDFIYIASWHLGLDTALGTSSGKKPLKQILEEASNERKIIVRALLWPDQRGRYGLGGHTKDQEKAKTFIDGLANGSAILDYRHMNYVGSHHQKLLIVHNPDGLVTFCGSMDIHPYRTNWHEVNCRVRGPAAKDLHDTFTERWKDFVRWEPSSALPPRVDLAPAPGQQGTAGGATVQIVRTYGDGTQLSRLVKLLPKTVSIIVPLPIRLFASPPMAGPSYDFAPQGERTIYQLIEKGIAEATQFIYIEDQYLLSSTKMRKGKSVSELLEDKLRAVKEKKDSIKKIIILIARTEQINNEQRQAWQRRRDFIDQLKKYDDPQDPKVVICQYKSPGEPFVHAKIWIFDDRFAIIGSANCNRRGYTHDSEVAAGIYDGEPDLYGDHLTAVQDLRMKLWEKHLGNPGPSHLLPALSMKFVDPIKSAHEWEHPSPTSRIERYDPNPQPPVPNPDSRLGKISWLHGMVLSSADEEWDHIIDPDGS